MISFELTEEQELVQQAMREFGEQVLRPAAREADEVEALPDAVIDQTWELGLLSTQLPEASQVSTPLQRLSSPQSSSMVQSTGRQAAPVST